MHCPAGLFKYQTYCFLLVTLPKLGHASWSVTQLIDIYQALSLSAFTHTSDCITAESNNSLCVQYALLNSIERPQCSIC